MSNIYEQINHATPIKEFDKDAWAQAKKEQKESAYAMVDEQLITLTSSPASFLQYLQTQAHFSQYTVTNALLIMVQKPEATQIADSSKWREGKHYIKKGEKGFTILEPDKEYQREDGSMGMGYNPKAMFDVSQVKNPPKMQKPSISKESLVYAMTYQSPVEIKILENEVREGNKVNYSVSDKTIYVSPGLDADTLLPELAKAYCYAQEHISNPEMQENSNYMGAESATYMLCQKYGIPTNDTRFAEQVTGYFEGMDAQDIKADLSYIKGISDEVSGRMEKGLQAKLHEKQTHERQDVR